MISRAACLISALILTLVLFAAPATAADAGAAEWNLHRAGPGRTSAVDVAPLKAQPVVAWKLPLGEKVVAEPVCWGGVIYVVREQGRKRQLCAVRAASGEVLAEKTLAKGGELHLAVWQGTVIVRSESRIATYPYASGRFRSGWKKRGEFSPFPLVHAGRLLTHDGSNLQVIDVKSGKVLAKDYGPTGMLSLAERSGSCDVVGTEVKEHEDYEGIYAFLNLVVVDRIETKKPAIRMKPSCDMGMTKRRDRGRRDGELEVIRMDGGWLVTTTAGFLAAKNSVCHGSLMRDGDRDCDAMSGIATVPAVEGGMAYGFDPEEGLLKMWPDGTYLPLVEGGVLPRGAKEGPASAARGTVFFGNWAVEVATGRVLWCLESFEPVTQLIPAADGILVAVTKDRCLVALAASKPTAKAEAPTAGSGGRERSSCREPEDGDGVLLVDGRQILGTVSRVAGGKIRVVSKAGGAAEFPEGEVLLAEAGGKVIHRGEEFPVYRIWRDALDGQCLGKLRAIFDSYRNAGFLGDCRRLLEEAKAHGLDPRQAEEWSSRLTSRAQSRSAHIRGNIRKKEDGFRATAAACIERGADWCEKRGLTVAASALLLDSDRVRPGRAEIETRAKSLIPAGFPWKEGKGAGRRWLAWAEKTLPAGAVFLAPDDPALRGAMGRKAIGFRTPNLLMLTTSEDLEAVTGCLRNGEGAVRALDALLTGETVSAVKSDAERLQVRIFGNRKEFLAAAGSDRAEFMAGYYSPSERMSRFYVPDEDEAEVLGRRLNEVLSHELTHQYVEERWLAGRSRGGHGPGCWIVEGLARFVEDQSLEMGRRGIRFDDETVSSLDASAQLDKLGRLIPMARFLQIDYEAFRSLSHERNVEVTLRNTLATNILSETNIFYEQAGALVFYLMHRAGPEKREALIRYAKACYGGKLGGETWKVLGYDSPAALEKPFREFLAGLRK